MNLIASLPLSAHLSVVRGHRGPPFFSELLYYFYRILSRIKCYLLHFLYLAGPFGKIKNDIVNRIKFLAFWNYYYSSKT